MRSRHIKVTIDLDRIRASAEQVRAKTRVPLIAVIKADAYGLGAAAVAGVLESIADDFAYFTIEEAREVGRPGLVLGPPTGEAAEYRDLRLRPAVTNRAEAAKFAGLPVAINVDTGMQWFGCRPEELDDLLTCCAVNEVFTHTNELTSAKLLRSLGRGRRLRLHAAATSLLDCPDAWLDAVRPGLALYRGAVRVTGKLVAVRETAGPVGYSGFEHPQVGIMLGGYSNHVRPGPVVINGRVQRMLEVGMNTTLVSVDPSDRTGNEVVLLGNELNETQLARQFGIRAHEVLCRYTAMGIRQYLSGGKPVNPHSACTTRSTAPAPRQT
ncbi:MAG: alanine racemase [Phycisphaerae bacterium]